MKIAIKKLENLGELALPAYATEHSAGMDLLAAISENITIKSGERKLVPTGIAIALSASYEAQVRPRSGLALKYGVTVLNAPGTIDADYRGEIGVILINHGKEDFVIERGMKIAQLIIAKYKQSNWNIVTDLESTARGAGGFGSTGEKVA